MASKRSSSCVPPPLSRAFGLSSGGLSCVFSLSLTELCCHGLQAFELSDNKQNIEKKIAWCSQQKGSWSLVAALAWQCGVVSWGGVDDEEE